jgi:hypothetical protein
MLTERSRRRKVVPMVRGRNESGRRRRQTISEGAVPARLISCRCSSDGWAMTPSGSRGVLNDAISLYFADATLASAFVARWCVGSKVATTGGVFHVPEDEPAPRVGAGLLRTP